MRSTFHTLLTFQHSTTLQDCVVWMKTTDGKIQHLYAGTPLRPRSPLTRLLTIALLFCADNKTAYHCYLAGHSLYVVSCVSCVSCVACVSWGACSHSYVFLLVGTSTRRWPCRRVTSSSWPKTWAPTSDSRRCARFTPLLCPFSPFDLFSPSSSPPSLPGRRLRRRYRDLRSPRQARHRLAL